MAKATSFSEKVAKQKAKAAEHAIVVKFVEARKPAGSKGWKFNERFLRLSSLDEIDKIK